jgi:hypothetical protein
MPKYLLSVILVVLLHILLTPHKPHYYLLMVKIGAFITSKKVLLSKLFLFAFTAIALAQNRGDSSKTLPLTDIDKKQGGVYIIKEPSVVFPALFINAQKQSLDYIEKFATDRKDYLINTYQKSKKFFPKVEAIFAKKRVPLEFKVLMALESGFNANAVSKAGAVGYWQIMDVVAKEYHMRYQPQRIKRKFKKGNKYIYKVRVVKKGGKDDRKNFIKSTYAAARYLKERSRNLKNDPLLVAASYNCGVGKVWSAMKKSGKVKPSFWDIKKYLPAQTRAYVMNFIALNVILSNYDKFENNTLSFKPMLIKLDNPNDSLQQKLPPVLPPTIKY